MTDQEIKETIAQALAFAFVRDDSRQIFKTSKDYFQCLEKLKEKFND
jgi:hypothetical protein